MLDSDRTLLACGIKWTGDVVSGGLVRVEGVGVRSVARVKWWPCRLPHQILQAGRTSFVRPPQGALYCVHIAVCVVCLLAMPTAITTTTLPRPFIAAAAARTPCQISSPDPYIHDHTGFPLPSRPRPLRLQLNPPLPLQHPAPVVSTTTTTAPSTRSKMSSTATLIPTTETARLVVVAPTPPATATTAASTHLLQHHHYDKFEEEEEDEVLDSFGFSFAKAYEYAHENVAATLRNPKLILGVAWNDSVSMPVLEGDVQLKAVSVLKVSVWYVLFFL